MKRSQPCGVPGRATSRRSESAVQTARKGTTKVIGSRELGGPVAWQQALWLCRQQKGSEFYSGAVEGIQEAFG